MNELLKQLHDIEGLDSISMWPLAPGWWVLIAFGFFLSCLIGWVLWCWIAYKRSWKHDTFLKLDRLEKRLSDQTAHVTVKILSEYLRRISLKRFSRHQCAGLVGQAWLKWLSENDPKQFDWEKKGLLLIDFPYAPDSCRPAVDQVKDLIQATRNWVC